MDNPQEVINKNQASHNRQTDYSESVQRYINDDIHNTLTDHARHLEIANQEMGEVKVRLGILESKVITAVRQNWAIILLIVGAAIAVLFKTK